MNLLVKLLRRMKPGDVVASFDSSSASRIEGGLDRLPLPVAIELWKLDANESVLVRGLIVEAEDLWGESLRLS